jgi:hypothetical protein
MATNVPKKAAKKSAVAASATEVFHLEDGENALVGVKALRVMLCPDGPLWFAQGLEIDYAAAGETMESAKANFENGLALTIQEHLTLHGKLEKFLRIAPQEVWDEFINAPPDTLKMELSAIAGYRITDSNSPIENAGTTPSMFPFNAIVFFEPREARAA